MTAYRNFIQDFPSRCLDVLELADKPTRLKDREVTMLIMAATSGFVIPFERLRTDRAAHPSGDSKRYRDASLRLTALMNETFLSALAPSATSWKFMPYCESIAGDPDSWAANLPKMTEGRTVKRIVKAIRNSLAHGSIFTRGDPISQIVLASKCPEEEGPGFSIVSVSPSDFRIFLTAWFQFLKDCKAPPQLLQQAFDTAA